MNDFTELIDRYIDMWNDTDTSRRRALIARAWTEDAIYLDPMMRGEGHDGIDAMVSEVQQRFPSHRFRRTSEVDCCADQVRFSWELAPQDGVPGATVKGTDFGVIEHGRLRSITGFLDAAPAADPALAGRPGRGWSVESFAAFWTRPDPALVPRALTPDVAGYWPGSAEPVRGVEQYTQRIADLLALVPDFRLEVAEHAASGDCVFIRWIARGTTEDGRFEFSGVDRVRTRDGLVAENMIFCSHPLVLRLAQSAASA